MSLRRPGKCEIPDDEFLPCPKDAIGLVDVRGDEYQCCAFHGAETVELGGAEAFVTYASLEAAASAS